eukprot:3462978-Prymnesium_polylepis.1
MAREESWWAACRPTGWLSPLCRPQKRWKPHLQHRSLAQSRRRDCVELELANVSENTRKIGGIVGGGNVGGGGCVGGATGGCSGFGGDGAGGG